MKIFLAEIRKSTKEEDIPLDVIAELTEGMPGVLNKEIFDYAVYDSRELEDLFNRGREKEKENNIKDAIECYASAAKQGYARAQRALAVFYERGWSDNDIMLDKNPDEAKRLYQLAAEQGDATAQYRLGMIYEDSLNKEDHKEVVRLYQLAADQGVVAAQNFLDELKKQDIDEQQEQGIDISDNEQDNDVSDNDEQDAEYDRSAEIKSTKKPQNNRHLASPSRSSSSLFDKKSDQEDEEHNEDGVDIADEEMAESAFGKGSNTSSSFRL